LHLLAAGLRWRGAAPCCRHAAGGARCAVRVWTALGAPHVRSPRLGLCSAPIMAGPALGRLPLRHGEGRLRRRPWRMGPLPSGPLPRGPASPADPCPVRRVACAWPVHKPAVHVCISPTSCVAWVGRAECARLRRRCNVFGPARCAVDEGWLGCAPGAVGWGSMDRRPRNRCLASPRVASRHSPGIPRIRGISSMHELNRGISCFVDILVHFTVCIARA
jgi:hypothetical protein